MIPPIGVVVTQPRSVFNKGTFMIKPPVKDDIPRGFEYLEKIDKFTIKQDIDLIEIFTHFEGSNKYQILNHRGETIYIAREESPDFWRTCCANHRGFTLHIAEKNEMDVMQLKRDFWFCIPSSCCLGLPCLMHYYEVYLPEDEETLGYIRKRCSCLRPSYEVTDEKKNVLYLITGRWCTCNCPRSIRRCCFCCYCCKIPFTILDVNENLKVGHIYKEWAGFFKECCTKSDAYSLEFNEEVDVEMKGILLAAIMVLDYEDYEEKLQSSKLTK